MRILKYSFYDLIRGKWTIVYCLFYLMLTTALFTLNTDLSKVVITLMNVVLALVPLIAIMFGVIFYYNSREFVELLLAQPITRKEIFLGQLLGLGMSLSTSLLVGIGLPFLVFGIFTSPELYNFLILLLVGIILSIIFSGLGFLIAMKFENRIKGFGIAIFCWLFLAIIYDGIFLLLLALFSDYPLEGMAITLSTLNPIDLSRTLILLKLDIAALMGYTGAVFHKFIGTINGLILVSSVLLVWILLPYWFVVRTARKKDF